MTTLEILIAARALIDAPEKWCQGMNAVDADGNQVWPTNPRAKARCGSGALSKVCQVYQSDVEDGQKAWDILADVVGGLFSNWQDEPSRTHAEVLAAWDAAIAIATARIENE